MSGINLKTANGGINIIPEDGTGTVDIPLARAGFGKILQVKQTVVDTEALYNTSSWTTLSGFAVIITPKAIDSNFLIIANVHYGQGSTGSDDYSFNLRTLKNGSALSYTINSSHGYGDFGIYNSAQDNLTMHMANFMRLDTTITGNLNPITYQLEVTTGGPSWNNNPVYINRANRFDDNWYANSRLRSTLTVMEVGA